MSKTNAEKMELLADRAESLLVCLKQRFPGLTQTTLDMCKIQFNKNIGKSIIESYSRVLESLAFNIVARINDLIYVDDLSKHSDQKNVTVPYSISDSITPYATAYGTPSFSPVPLLSLACGEKTSFRIRKGHNHGFSVKVLSDYLNCETRGRNDSTIINISESIPRMNEL